jgi:hypothetical protein
MVRAAAMAAVSSRARTFISPRLARAEEDGVKMRV